MARRRRFVYRTTKGGRLMRKRTRDRSAKSPSKYGNGFLGRVFNTNWLFGNHRHRKYSNRKGWWLA